MVAPGHLLSTTPAGNPLWSGGTDGPEGSLLIIPIVLLLLAWLLVIYRRPQACAILRTGNYGAAGRLKEEPMRLWLNRTGEVSLREQLITQVVLGILCHELAPGQRLPSTRDLSRRFGIHANTASAAYRQLESEGWVELRHGSGVFVRTTAPRVSS